MVEQWLWVQGLTLRSANDQGFPCPLTTKSTPEPLTNAARLYNTLTQTKEPFQTVEAGKVGMYVCGPTVYSNSHVGHMVGPVIFDTIKRYLVYLGYEVTWVVNITDVDDKLIIQAEKDGTTVKELADRVTEDYLRLPLSRSGSTGSTTCRRRPSTSPRSSR